MRRGALMAEIFDFAELSNADGAPPAPDQSCEDPAARSSIQGYDYEPNDVEQTPSWTWRCLGCDSNVCSWTTSGWVCGGCGGADFYRTNSPAKKVNGQGTWMFLPFSGDQVGPGERPAVPGEQKPVSRRRRRRRHFGDPGGHGGDERAESEVPTLDPVIDPDLPLPPRRPGGELHDQDPLPPRHRDGPRRDLLHERTPGAASSNDDRLLGALRSLVNAKGRQDDDWVSLSGPQRGVRWRGGSPPLPPKWQYDRDDLRAFTPSLSRRWRFGSCKWPPT